MAIRNIRVSDLTGEVIPDGELVEVIIRSHPNLDAPKRLDAANVELQGLGDSANIVTIELKHNGASRTVNVTLDDFEKVVPKDALKNAAPTRGRRPGYRPAPKSA